MNKNYLYWIALVAVVVVVIIYSKGSNNDDINPTPTITVSETPTPEPSPTPSVLSNAIKPVLSKTVKPTPALVAQETKSYIQLATEFDEDGNRRIAINKDDCSNIVPSNVAYKNNAQIMIDNTFSANPHILKIGDREYSLNAGQWILATLSSINLPINLPIYCGGIELGQIELLK